MRRARSLELIRLDPEIKRTLRRLKKERQDQILAMTDGANQNGENQEQLALHDYFRPVVNDNYSDLAPNYQC